MQRRRGLDIFYFLKKKCVFVCFFQAEDGIRDAQESRGLGDVYKRQLLSIVQMPSGIPVATVAIGGARNAGLLALQILAVGDAALQKKLLAFKARLATDSRAKNRNLAG